MEVRELRRKEGEGEEEDRAEEGREIRDRERRIG